MPIKQWTIFVKKERFAGFKMGFFAHCLELPGFTAQGESLDEVLDNMEGAVLLGLKDLKEKGEEIPVQVPHVELDYLPNPPDVMTTIKVDVPEELLTVVESSS